MHHKNIKLRQQGKHVPCNKRDKQDIFIGYSEQYLATFQKNDD